MPALQQFRFVVNPTGQNSQSRSWGALYTLCQVEAVFKIEACTLRILGCKRTGVEHRQSFLPVTTTIFAGALPQVKGYLNGAIASR